MASLLNDTYAPIFVNRAQLCLDECTDLFSQVYRGVSTELIETAFEDTIRLFHGDYPGFRACDTPYHDLEHTMSVTLATMRLIAGAAQENEIIGSGFAEAALVAALFHDAGLIARTDEEVSSGAALTVGHENRSARFAANYLAEKGRDELGLCNIERIISCTAMAVDPGSIRFSSREERIAGYILGSADFSAQMSDRLYLEKLPLLFLEMREAGIPMYTDAFDLLQRTGEFYETFVKARLEQDFENVVRFAGAYFARFESQPRNLYLEYIGKNLDYLNTAVAAGPDDWWTHLRREGVVERALDRLTA